MNLVSIRNLSITLARPLFQDLTATIDRGDRLGLVAANGRGKSTLFRLIDGSSDATSGEVTRARNLRISLVPQDLPAAMGGLSFREAVCQLVADEIWRADVLLDEMAIPPGLQDRNLSDLSGGWQRMALLARSWVTGPDLVLLDEPTNHLDLARIGQLERWLTGLPRDTALVIASHDRAFLDRVTNRTLFLRPEASVSFDLPYGKARLALAEADAAQDRQYQNDMRKVAELRKQAAKLKNIGINSGSDLLVVKTKQLSERAAKLESSARPGHQERSAGVIRLSPAEAASKAVVTLNDATISAPDGRPLFRTGQKWIVKGDRVVLLGANGAGKTRLVNAIRNAFDTPGPVRAAPSARLGYSDQDLAMIASDETPHDTLAQRFDHGDQAVRTALASAGIAPEWQTQPVSRLSGGQRARLALLVLRWTRPSFYLLDEPTNHLDIDGQEALEEELQQEGTCALIVSHDRSFVRAVGTRFWMIAGRHLNEVADPEDFFRSEMNSA